MAKHTIVLIPGDGIGPEVTGAAQARDRGGGLSRRMGRASRRRRRVRAGLRQRPARADSSPPSHAQARAQGPGHHAGRQGIQVASTSSCGRSSTSTPPCDRCAALPGVKTRFDDVDMVIVRENTEGLYSGIENEVVPGVVTSLKVAIEARLHAHRPLRLPLRDQAAAQEDHGVPQGQHHEADRRAVPQTARARSTRRNIPTSSMRR